MSAAAQGSAGMTTITPELFSFLIHYSLYAGSYGLMYQCIKEKHEYLGFHHEARKSGGDFILNQCDSYFSCKTPELSILGLLLNAERKHFNVCQETEVLCLK